MRNRKVPDLILERVWQINETVLAQLGVKALILDVDNTLSTHGAPVPAGEVVPWMQKMNEIKVPLIILSNNTQKRVQPFAKRLNLEFVHFAIKPLPGGFKRAARLLKLPPEQIGVVGDQVFTDILGGNLAGMKTILVMPLGESGTRFIRFKRYFEKKYINLYYKNKRDE